MSTGTVAVKEEVEKVDLHIINLGPELTPSECTDRVSSVLENIAYQNDQENRSDVWIILDLTRAGVPGSFLFGLLGYANSAEFNTSLKRISVCADSAETKKRMEQFGLLSNPKGKIKLFKNAHEAFQEFRINAHID